MIFPTHIGLFNYYFLFPVSEYLIFLGMQTAADKNDQIIKEIENVMVEVENARDEVDTVLFEVKNVKVEVENVKFEVENVKTEIFNVKLEMKDFKNQVSADMSKLVKALEKFEMLLKKNPDSYF